MRLIVKVYDAQGIQIGIVPYVKSASITRVLDGCGSIGIEGFASDERTLELFQNERRVRVEVEEQGSYLREIGRGIIRKLKTGLASGGYTFSVDGPDALDELKRISTLFNRAYEYQPLEDICADLVSLAGWDAEVTVPNNADYVSARFDGSSVLKALQTLVSSQGYHLRLGEEPGIVEVGAFGEVLDLRLLNAETLPAEAYQNPKIAFIESISITEDTEAVYNRAFVFGAGQNIDAMLTLEKSGRSNPYEIKTMVGPDGRTLWYIEDEDSIAEMGPIERVVTYPDIAPLANNDTAERRAANMLYDAAKVGLRRNCRALKSYSISLKKCEQTIRAGDKVRVVYKGIVEKDGVPFTFQNIDDEFWVLKVTESVGDGKSVRLEVSNVDQPEGTAARIVVGTLEKIEVRGISAQPSFVRSTQGPYQEAMDADHAVSVPITFGNATFRLERCVLRIKTRAFRATAAGAAAAEIPVVTSDVSGQHSHAMLFFSSPTPATGTSIKQYSGYEGTPGNFTALNLDTNDNVTLYTDPETVGHTHDVTIPPHSHDLVYGIYDDDQLPFGIKIMIHGNLVADGLGGLVATDATAIEGEYDITDILNGAGLRQTHRVEITCTGGQGTVEVEHESYELISPIKLS